MRLLTSHNDVEQDDYLVTVRRCGVDSFMVDKDVVFRVKHKAATSCDLRSNEKSARGVLVANHLAQHRFRFAYKNEAKLCNK